MTKNVYDVCPVYESDRFRLRLVEREDAEALLRCYADPAARPCFNMDSCDFGYDEAPSLETQRRVVDIWLEVYRLRQFVRFAIVDRADGAAVGTVEMFGGKHGVLRVDTASAYETQEALSELFGLANAFFDDFGCERMVTKVFDASPQRTRALVACGYAPYPAGKDWTRQGYWAKLAPAAPLALTCRTLTPALLEDYLHFFDHVAFADHPEWSNCYCMHFHDESAMASDAPTNRECAIACIHSGQLQGTLAYDGEDVVGWCNAGDKGSFPNLALPEELREDNDQDGNVLSVVCLTVAPALREHGVATALLAQVCADAAVRGFDWVEGYPQLDATDPYHNHHGPLGLYEKLGFAVHRTSARQAVVRKALR